MFGYRFGTACAAFKKEGRADLALVVSDVPAVAAGTFTQNLFPAAPVLIGKDILQHKALARAVLINVGQANACTGEEGIRRCHMTQKMVAEAVGLFPDEILPASTGVIGPQLLLDHWEKAIPALAENLGKATAEDFAHAIMTTDAFPKISSREIILFGSRVHFLGIAKGAGMICPNMATMLCIVLSDLVVDAPIWTGLLKESVGLTFNRVSVDGDTSTNDTVYALANGLSGVKLDSINRSKCASALQGILGDLAYMLVKDGEGASKVAHIKVIGAKSDKDAEQVARTVGHSQLVKTALYGQDANWGRIVAAAGRSGVSFVPENLKLSLCGVELFRNGQPVDIDFDSLLAESLKKRDLQIEISLGEGSGKYTLLASDLTHDYVNLNSDYRS